MILVCSKVLLLPLKEPTLEEKTINEVKTIDGSDSDADESNILLKKKQKTPPVHKKRLIIKVIICAVVFLLAAVSIWIPKIYTIDAINAFGRFMESNYEKSGDAPPDWDVTSQNSTYQYILIILKAETSYSCLELGRQAIGIIFLIFGFLTM